MKLIRVERSIEIYNRNEELISEISVDLIPFDELKEIVPPNEDDPLLYDGYVLDISQLSMLNNYLSEIIKADFTLYSYVLTCGGIYDWEATEL